MLTLSVLGYPKVPRWTQPRNSSMKTMEGAFSRAKRNTSRTILGPSPRYFWTNSEPTIPCTGPLTDVKMIVKQHWHNNWHNNWHQLASDKRTRRTLVMTQIYLETWGCSHFWPQRFFSASHIPIRLKQSQPSFEWRWPWSCWPRPWPTSSSPCPAGHRAAHHWAGRCRSARRVPCASAATPPGPVEALVRRNGDSPKYSHDTKKRDGTGGGLLHTVSRNRNIVQGARQGLGTKTFQEMDGANSETLRPAP